MNNSTLETYLTNGINKIAKDIIKTSFSNPKESKYAIQFGLSCKNKNETRHILSNEGYHVPPFLIASITTSCNLHCKGCYARENNLCSDISTNSQLTKDEWNRIFSEADKLGISFILLAGGEPLMRKDVIECATHYPNILFPIFTNSTLIDASYITLFDKNRNLLPILSIEGNHNATDLRRGNGIYQIVMTKMSALEERSVLFALSLTTTTENIEEITSPEFVENVYSKGCKGMIYVEYVPLTKGTEHLALNDEDRSFFKSRVDALKLKYENMLFISFPGDERSSGGCLAAGRGFFHINPYGGAEPCPFSPYTDTNVKTTSLKEAIQSSLFTKIRENEILNEDHSGGCVLYKYRSEVEK